MALVSKPLGPPRWERTLRGPETFADDIEYIGARVGPRIGADKRVAGEREDYVLRRLLAAMWKEGRLRFPVDIRAEPDTPNEPDFLLAWVDGETLGIEVTEATDEEYQEWLTDSERELPPDGLMDDPFEPSAGKAAADVLGAVKRKVDKFDEGKYRQPRACDLAVYDNSAWSGYTKAEDILAAMGRPEALLGRFRQIHLVRDDHVYLDLFGQLGRIDVRNLYEIDFVAWLRDQVERLRRRDASGLDFANIGEELDSLARKDQREVRSHLRNLIAHLLKWEHQPSRRSRSWQRSIDNARARLGDILADSPSLANEEFLQKEIGDQYPKAKRQVARETKLPESSLPSTSPFTIEQLFDESYPAPDAPNKD